MRIMLYNVRV